MTAFHEVLFPLDIALKRRGRAAAPHRRGRARLRRRGAQRALGAFAAALRCGYGVKTSTRCRRWWSFSRERRGRLYGFRWRDRLDYSSAAPDAAVTPFDQDFGSGDGTGASFALSKTYGSVYSPYRRPIGKPVADSVRVAVGGTETTAGTAFTVDPTSGVVTFLAGHIPASGAAVDGGFLFDVPVRFDTDYLEVDLSAFAAGAVPKIPLVEIRA